MCAGRAAEELVYGQDEMSTINQRRLVLARRIVQKLTVASAMTDNPLIGPRTISTPFRRGGKSLKQIVSNRVSQGVCKIFSGSYSDIACAVSSCTSNVVCCVHDTK